MQYRFCCLWLQAHRQDEEEQEQEQEEQEEQEYIGLANEATPGSRAQDSDATLSHSNAADGQGNGGDCSIMLGVVLRTMGLTQGLSEQQRHSVALAMRRCDRTRGELLFREGEPADYFYIVPAATLTETYYVV